MSNNQEVEWDGTSRFFSYDDARTIADVARDASVGMTYRTPARDDGAPGMFIHVEGEARIVRDIARVRRTLGPIARPLVPGTGRRPTGW